MSLRRPQSLIRYQPYVGLQIRGGGGAADPHFEGTSAAQNWEFRWPRAVKDGASHRHVPQLAPFSNLAQQQAASAHVAQPDEVDGESEALAEDTAEHVHIFWRRHAAAQHALAIGTDLGRQRAGAPLERPSIARIRRIDLAVRKREQSFERDERVGLSQPGVRRNDVHARSGRPGRMVRRSEPPRVGQFAAKVQSADEAEDVAELGALLRTKLFSERKGRLRRPDLLRAL